MIGKLLNFILPDTRPSAHDTESVTLLQLSGTLLGKMNEVITAFNDLETRLTANINEYIGEAQQDQEAFATAMRQEFQDFIDTVDLKITGVENLEETLTSIQSSIRNLETRVKTLEENGTSPTYPEGEEVSF